MPQETVQIFKSRTQLFFTLLFGAAVMLCTSCAEKTIANESSVKDPETRVFFDDFDKVWTAIHLAVRKYPVLVDNRDSGLLETNFVKGEKFFTDPDDNRPKQGLRYKIIIRAVKGKVENKNAIKVTVLKSAEVQPDFFSGFKRISSNGLEEHTVLYRISRFIEIDHLLNKKDAH